MILLVDIGNSRIKCATLDAGVFNSVLSYRHEESTFHEMAAKTFPIFPDAIYTVCVASSEIEEQFVRDCFQLWGVKPIRFASTTECSGVVNGYKEPLRLGADRWAAIIGAYRLYQGALVVIDCGTACSADIVDARGQHLGGAIVPGYHMMQQALQQGTAKIQMTGNDGAAPHLGTTTDECIHFGSIVALCGFIDRIRQVAVQKLGGVTVVITGGDAARLLPHLPFDVIHKDDLVFRGMAVMGEEAATGECE